MPFNMSKCNQDFGTGFTHNDLSIFLQLSS
jgi:hypothetical protein